ncbi:MAG: tetratricopeptide repeat protein, partial [Desulfosudaceae bacterium]
MAVNQNLSGHPTPPTRPWSLAAVFFILFAAAFLIYGDSLRAPFYFDDLTNIIENPHIHLTRLDLSRIKEIPRGRPTGRSVPFFTFALNYYFHRDQVTGYHLFNILIHIGCGLMVFLLTGQTLRLCGRQSLLIPLLAALLWLTHPLHTQSVTYIVQRINSLAALFYLMALWFYVKFRLSLKNKEPVRFTSSPVLPAAAALGCGLLALLSKQNSASLPVIILLYEWYFFQNRDRSRVKKNWPWLLAMVLSIVIIALVYLGGNPIDRIMAGYENQPFNMGQRLLSQGRVVIYYISLLVFPHPGRLNIDYDFPVSAGLADPATTALALAALAALLAAAGMAQKDRLLSFALIWFLVTLAVESSFIGLMLVFEHRTYLPSVFPVIALTAVFFRQVRPVSLAVILLAAFMAVNGYWTFQRNAVWQDQLGFWRDCAQKSPNKVRPRNNYGMALAESDDFEAAVTEYERSIALSRGTLPYPHNNLGMLYFQRGDLTRAAEHFKKAIRTDPDFFKPYLNLGTLLNRSGDNQRALVFLEEALRHNRYFPAIHVALAKAYYETG